LNEALDAALLVFRARGYHEASLVDLGTAMGLTPGSIYKAFDDKAQIFVAAFQRYRDQRESLLRQRLATEKTARRKIEETLRFYAQSASGVEGQLGCLVVGAITDLSTLDLATANLITDAINRNETFLRELIKSGQADGSVATSVNPSSAASTLLCMTQGMRVIGKLGRSAAEMDAVVDEAMKILS
jgi:AcrR family transcriptional regulator